MKVSRRSRILLRLQGLTFSLLFSASIGLLAWLSTQYVYQADWTAGARNTVSADTRKLLAELDQPVQITAFVRDEGNLRRQIRDLVGSYQRFKGDISLEFINPDTAPEQVRELGIRSGGELRVSYRGRSENIQTLSEQTLSNSLLRLSRQEERWIAFLTGHGEREPLGEANHGLGIFGGELERKGLNIQTVNLTQTEIPANTSLLVIAGPRVKLLPGEVDALRHYVEQGGNLLWLAEPGDLHGLEPLAELLGIDFLPGQVVDAGSQMFGIDNPTFVVIAAYPEHEITGDMSAVTVFPEAAAIEMHDDGTWKQQPLLTTLPRSWTELGELAGEISFDADTDERAGPLDIGVILTRDRPAAAGAEAAEDLPGQRVIVVGDGDFLSNTYLGNAGNLMLGLNMVHWLGHDDAFINIRVQGAPDTSLELGRTAQAVIGLGLLFGLPVLLLVCGLLIWLRRRRR
jgi:gliding motility-associatede transport system auxiliary component